jgi:regulator of cell morphogenesis and NO signaling
MNQLGQTVSAIVLTQSGAAQIFERFHIDYCCGGQKTLAEACAAAGVEAGEIERLLAAAKQPDAEFKDYAALSLTELLGHIEATHHVFTRREIERLTPLMEKVCAKHGAAHPELNRLRELFRALCDELTPHLQKEEMILFPYIRALVAAQAGGRVPQPPFGTVRNPVQMMSLEHDDAGQLLKEMRQVSGDYVPPATACTSYKLLYQGLAAFEQDLHQHIHLENNALFPRAIALEESCSCK